MIWRYEMTQTELGIFFVSGLSVAMLAVAAFVFFLIRHPRRGRDDDGKRHDQ